MAVDVVVVFVVNAVVVRQVELVVKTVDVVVEIGGQV